MNNWYLIYNKNDILHYNTNHDPRTGQFTTSKAGARILGATNINGSYNSRKKTGAYFEKSIKQGKGKDNISPVESITKQAKSGTDSSKEVVNNAIRLRNRINRARTAKNIDLSTKSDKEMRDYINRINLERQYLDALDGNTRSEGLEYLGDIIGLIGGIAGIAAAGATIYTVLKTTGG